MYSARTGLGVGGYLFLLFVCCCSFFLGGELFQLQVVFLCQSELDMSRVF